MLRYRKLCMCGMVAKWKGVGLVNQRSRAFSAFGDQVALSGANTLLPITRDIKHDCGATTSLLLALYSV